MKIHVIADYDSDWTAERVPSRPYRWEGEDGQNSYVYHIIDVPAWRYYSYVFSQWLVRQARRLDFFPWSVISQRQRVIREKENERLMRQRIAREVQNYRP